MSTVVIHGEPLGEFQTNCYVVSTRAAKGAPLDRACWVVDPGEDPQGIVNYLRQNELDPQAILLTHAHADHIAGLEEMRNEFPNAPVLAHPAERAFYGDPQLNLSVFVGRPFTTREPTGDLVEGQELMLNGVRWMVRHTPGHSPGGITLVCDSARAALVGDTLFAGSIGRVDFPTSDPAAMHHSLHKVILTLPDSTAVYPGHGPSTTLARERAGNPFLRDHSWAGV